jgi:hypothetical protein
MRADTPSREISVPFSTPQIGAKAKTDAFHNPFAESAQQTAVR